MNLSISILNSLIGTVDTTAFQTFFNCTFYRKISNIYKVKKSLIIVFNVQLTEIPNMKEKLYLWQNFIHDISYRYLCFKLFSFFLPYVLCYYMRPVPFKQIPL